MTQQSVIIHKERHKETRFEKGVRLFQMGHVKKIPQVLGSQLYKVRSETKPDVSYDVIMFKDGNVFCSCPDSLYNNEICKHTWSVMSYETIVS